MAIINIPVTNEERKAVACAIDSFVKLQTVTYMSRTMLAEQSGISTGKLRLVLQDMLEHKQIEAHQTNDSKAKPRYMFVLTEAGKVLLQ